MPVELTDDLLLSVQRPSRYVGGEINTVVKDHARARASIALAFPDVYDLAMDYQGFQILYPLVNARTEFVAERVTCPWPDMADAMRRRGVLLYGLESRTPLREFHLIGFTLQHELNYTNILEMLDLAGLPVLAADRRDLFPIVIAGGPGALAPEPLAPFVDAFVIGEGEEAITQLLEICARSRDGGPPAKEAMLLEMANVPGVYVPRFYEPDEDGCVHRIRGDVPESIIRRLYDISQETFSVRPVVPLQRIVSERLTLEIKRGCTRGCRFCQAGMITRPLRERTQEQILALTEQGLANTGHREVSLMSLSSADYSALAPLMRKINDRHEKEHVSIALSSIRVNAFDVQFAEEIKRVKKTGFTFAPEAGTERLRSVINKELSDENFLNVTAQVFSRGWQRLKYYFMCSLPTETDEDLMGIVDITERSLAIGRRFWGKNFEIAVSVSPFIAKPHTPFQWEGLLRREEVDRRWHLVADSLRSRNVRVRPHSANQAWVEAALCRGDRRVGMAMLRAWRQGARFCSWDEHFRLDLWERSFGEEGIDTDDLIHATWDHGRPLPWDHIDAALGKKFLAREHRKAMAKTLTPDCAFTHCVGCDTCDFESVKNEVVCEKPLNTYDSIGKAPPPAKPHRPEPPGDGPEPTVRLRVRLTKQGLMKYLAHLDYAKVIHQVIARAKVPIAFSQGFSPKPRVMFAPPIPLGYTSTAEGADLIFDQEGDPERWLAALRDSSPRGIEWHLAAVGHPHDPSLGSEVTQADYRVVIRRPGESLDLSPEELQSRIDAFLASESCPVEEKRFPKRSNGRRNGRNGRGGRSGPASVKAKDFRALTRTLALDASDPDRLVIDARLAAGNGGSLDPLRLLSQVTGNEVKLGDRVAVERTALWTERAGTLVSAFGERTARQTV
jgi:radical SAM family uncharacterized protein/radical SAM-linked protein